MLTEFNFEKENQVVIVSLKLPSISDEENNNSIEELKLLSQTLGFAVKEIFVQKKDRIEPDYYIGKGKVEEIKLYLSDNNIDAVLFDSELTGVQERNLEKLLNTTIFGRTEVILHIFKKRARTNEAKLQVQLASYEYMLPRLRNMWDHFSRVEGGIGLRGGEGEKQLELDKRIIKNQISKIKEKLKKIDKQMSNRRKNREDTNLVSLVGYTNAGKTSLINLLAKTNLFAENMLFSTLDSTVRRVFINDNLTILLNDTVGFINKLPHGLVASFKSTLDEITNSKLILHIIDGSSHSIKNNIQSVNKVLEEIDALNIPTIRVFNKIDLLNNGISDIMEEKTENDIFISVKKKIGIEELKEKINKFFE
ncbi:MAG: GTPase HflX [Spirochaetes bacterium GWC1_27_15]|nr:MAG: GTPase HflX [Spirochaetes bacterium GWB1_27_13]OHD25175.1 MAG: GTPase HflX [Spirochaetes bacterium GWC1_27_15]